jgi:hypothetical protein
MNRLFLIVLPGLAAMLVSAEPTAPSSTEKAAAAAKRAVSAPPRSFAMPPRLGVTLARPAGDLRAQLPELPEGCGFVIEKVDSAGPAEKAGLAAHDVIWQMDGQWLINEAQLTVLLAQHQPGDAVKIDYFRAGKAGEAELLLGAALPGQGFETTQPGPPLVTRPPLPGMPVRWVDVPSRTASIDSDDGRAELTADRNGLRLVISDSDGRTIQEGLLFDSKGEINAPPAWRERVKSLHAALIESLQRAQTARKPRLRVIPSLDRESR